MAPFLDESLIDDADSIAARDTGQTLRALATAGAQVREAITLSGEAGIDRVQAMTVFVKVAEAGGFAGAARQLGMSAPSAATGPRPRPVRCRPTSGPSCST